MARGKPHGPTRFPMAPGITPRRCRASVVPDPRHRYEAGDVPLWQVPCARVGVLRARHGGDGMEMIRNVSAADRSVPPSLGIRAHEGGPSRGHCRVVASSRFSCPRCRPTVRIDHNTLRLDHSDCRQLDDTCRNSSRAVVRARGDRPRLRPLPGLGARCRQPNEHDCLVRQHSVGVLAVGLEAAVLKCVVSRSNTAAMLPRLALPEVQRSVDLDDPATRWSP